MKQYDAVVIGGGILGCFAARNLRRWNLTVLLIEQQEDVCRGITRANTAICYPGYDNKPGTLKAELTVRGNTGFDDLCRELQVPFSRCGSLMTATGEKGEQTLQKKLEQGKRNGVPGLELLTGDEARQREPMLSGSVTAALYAPTTGTVNPWLLGIAAYENALQNGAQARLNTQVVDVKQQEEGFLVVTDGGTVRCKTVLNCAGADADRIGAMLGRSNVTLKLDGTDFLVLDREVPGPKYIIFEEREVGKGITAVPCVEGNLLLDSPARPMEVPYATTHAGMNLIRSHTAQLLPGVDTSRVIRSFGALRPNPKTSDGKNINDFSVENPVSGFYSLVGIKTPGLTCAQELGAYLAEKVAALLAAEKNPEFDPHRKAITREDHEIVCLCEGVTKGQVLQAIRRGALSVEGVKRRVGTGMGHCQGSRCSRQIEKLLEECRNGAL